MATLWYIETDMGCGIRDYGTRSILRARRAALDEVGTRNFKGIRQATHGDIDDVKSMGGYIPTTAK